MACDARPLQYLSPLPANSPRREQFVCSSCTTYDIAALIQFSPPLPIFPSFLNGHIQTTQSDYSLEQDLVLACLSSRSSLLRYIVRGLEQPPILLSRAVRSSVPAFFPQQPSDRAARLFSNTPVAKRSFSLNLRSSAELWRNVVLELGRPPSAHP